MTARADLHVHSSASDGVLPPAELVELAASRGLEVLALTDHDSVEGVAAAQAAAERRDGLMLIPGVEMGTDIPRAEVHVLGYFLDPKDPKLLATLRRLRESRTLRGRRIVEKLRAMGYGVEWERVQKIAGEAAVGRPHIAAALLEKGYVSDMAEAFDKLIGRNGPAYAEREKMIPAEAVATIVDLGGVAALAHPRDLENLDNLLVELKRAGLRCMEVYYKDYLASEMELLLQTARRHDLLPIGGTDYHGIYGADEPLPGDIPFPDEAIDAFLALADERRRGRRTP